MTARISQRQSFWRFSSSALYICRSCSRSTSFRGWFASRTPRCSIVSTCSGVVLLSRGSRLTANDDDPPACRPCRRPASIVFRQRTRLAASHRHGGAVRLVDDHALVGVVRDGQRHPVADALIGRDRTGRGIPRLEQGRHERHELRRPGELAVGAVASRWPARRACPLPIDFSTTAASPVSNRASTRASPSLSPSMRRYFQKRILVKSLN